MRPATDALPKPMLPIAGKPLLEHQLAWLRSAGVVDVLMLLGYKAEAVSSYFGDGKRFGVSLSYHVETEPRGTAGCLKDAAARLGEDTLVVYGDLYVELDLKPLLAFHRSHTGAATLVLRKTDHPRDSDLAELDGDRVTALYRAQSGQPCGDVGLAAVWVVRKRLLEAVPADKPSDFGRDVFPAALARGERLMGYQTSEFVCDLGTPERIEAFSQRRAKS